MSLVAFDDAQAKWQAYCEAWANFEAVILRQVERSGLSPMPERRSQRLSAGLRNWAYSEIA